MVGCCEYGNELSDSMQCGEFFCTSRGTVHVYLCELQLVASLVQVAVHAYLCELQTLTSHSWSVATFFKC